jgi:hypothetical protein
MAGLFKAFKAAIAVAAVVGVVGEEASGEAPALRGLGSSNNPVCSAILNSWWPARLAQQANVTELDTECSTYSGDYGACNSATNRTAYSGKVPTSTLNAACTTQGHHDLTCISNLCNSYNNGLCTLQETGGQCSWLSAEQVKAANTFLGYSRYAGYGCYRNPCNQPGAGKLTQSECASKANGILSCTWCSNIGGGMGCQATTPTTDGACATVVTSSTIPKSSIWQIIGKTSCQCSDVYGACNQAVAESRGGSYKKVF